MKPRVKSIYVSNIFCIPQVGKYIPNIVEFILKVRKLEDLLVWVEYSDKICWEKLPKPIQYYFSKHCCDVIDIKYKDKEWLEGWEPSKKNYNLDMYL